MPREAALEFRLQRLLGRCQLKTVLEAVEVVAFYRCSQVDAEVLVSRALRERLAL